MKRTDRLEPRYRAEAVTELNLVPLTVPPRAPWLCRPA